MKITVITGPDGSVLGTARHPEGGADASRRGEPGFRLVAGPGQTAHEIELPSHLEKVESPEELHRALQQHLESISRSHKPKPGTTRSGRS
jgi:hypothetical protein